MSLSWVCCKFGSFGTKRSRFCPRNFSREERGKTEYHRVLNLPFTGHFKAKPIYWVVCPASRPYWRQQVSHLERTLDGVSRPCHWDSLSTVWASLNMHCHESLNFNSARKKHHSKVGASPFDGFALRTHFLKGLHG